MKGLKFGMPPLKANDIEVQTVFEMCYKNFKDLPIKKRLYSKECFKKKFSEYAYTYCQKFHSRKERNLTDEEVKGLPELKQDQNIVIVKVDKGNCVVILQKDYYIHELENLLSDTSRFCLLPKDPILKREQKLIHHLLKLKNDRVITDQFYNKTRPNGSQPACLYGLPKVHKKDIPL